MDNEIDLQGNPLVRKEELEIIYDGPSFDGKMEVPHLISQLKSTEIVINEIIKELYKSKTLENPKEIKLYLKLKRGSFQEIISIVFNHPLAIAIVGGCIVALFNNILNKKNKKCEINIENLTQNVQLVNELKQIISPLQNEEDNITITSTANKDTNTKILFSDRLAVKELIKKLQEEVLVENYEEEFFGYLNMVNIDRVSYGFTLEGTNKHIPVTFRDNPPLSDIKEILGERVKIDAIATYRNKELSKLDIITHTLKKRKNLNDFFKNI